MLTDRLIAHEIKPVNSVLYIVIFYAMCNCEILYLHVSFSRRMKWIWIIIFITGKSAEYFFTQKLPKTAPVKRKKDLVLECMLSDPRPSVIWMKNGEKIEVYITFLHF